MTDQNASRKNARDSLAEIAVAIENAKYFYIDGDDKEAEMWEETLNVIHKESAEAIYELGEFKKEYFGKPQDDAREDALADAEGRHSFGKKN